MVSYLFAGVLYCTVLSGTVLYCSVQVSVGGVSITVVGWFVATRVAKYSCTLSLYRRCGGTGSFAVVRSAATTIYL